MSSDFATDWDDRLWRRVHPEALSGCWLWHGDVSPFGHGVVTTRSNGKRYRVMAHRTAFQMARGAIPEGMSVLHKCDVPACVNPDHLFLGTHRDNMADMKAKGRGRGCRGETSPSSRFTASEVLAFRAEAAAGGSIRAMAKRVGVNSGTLWKIVRGVKWAHLSKEER